MINVFLTLIGLLTYILSCLYLGRNEKNTYQKRIAFLNSVFNFIILAFISIFIPPFPRSESNIFPFISWIFFGELLFTVSHRIFHTKYLYCYHKQHHLNNPSYTTSSFDASILEFLIGNILPTVIPIYIIPGTFILQVFYVIFIVYNVVLGHGQEGPHTIHHKKFNCNYGQGLYLYDRIFGTYRSV